MPLMPVLDQIDAELPNAINRLFDLLRIQSISTDPAFIPQCDAAADWLVADLKSIGIDASKRPTTGHPMVMGHVAGTGPHLLFYGHYDVLPVDPLDLWHRDPFDPELQETPKGQVIRGRGSSDDKGQLMTFVEACRAWKAVHGSLPCQITFFFEGEEESGSPSLVPFMRENAAELTADIALICDTGLFESAVPANNHPVARTGGRRIHHHRPRPRPAFRHVRWHRHQSDPGHVQHHRRFARRRWAHHPARILRRRTRTQR